MRRRNKQGNVYGPYADKDGWWRVIVERPRPGAAKPERAVWREETEAEAERTANKWRRELQRSSLDVSAAIKEYLADRKGSVSDGTIETDGHRLRAMFKGSDYVAVSDITARLAGELYAALAARPRQAADTHRNTLATTKKFMAWCKEKGYAAGNPFAEVKGKGQRKTGKEQLRVDEGRKFLATALDLIERDGDLGALAALVCLLLGLRAAEVARLAARDIDDDGRLLWVGKSKTKAGIRKLQIPVVLSKHLVRLAPAKGPLFEGRDRHWVRYHVQRVCRLAGVTEVCAHGLRGSHASFATESGTASENVVRSLGWESIAVGDRHYIDPTASANAKAKRALTVLEGGAR